MRILHVGCGFRPWRRGGLVAYAEDLMAAQVQRGDEVAYFFSGRMYPLSRRPSLRRWVRDDIPMYEVVNSPLYDHGRQPVLEVSEPQVERLLAETIEEFRPDVMHLQELAGLPSSVIPLARRLGVTAVVTLQDYFFVCPNFKLVDARGRICVHHDVAASCIATVARAPRPSSALFDATVSYELEKLPVLQRFDAPRRHQHVHRIARSVGRRVVPTAGPQGDAEDFRRRRVVNVEHLNAADCVIAMSQRVADIHVGLGVDPERTRTLHLTLGHIAGLRPRRAEPRTPVTFATLAAFESFEKGGQLLLDAVRLLSARVPAGSFRMIVFGWIAPQFSKAAAELAPIELRAPFEPHQLDAMLDEVDVGVMPSVWEEAYGYAGVEFLAKAIPVVANAIGGIPEYVEPGRTGWLNRSCSAEELATIMAELVEHPDRVTELNTRLRAERPAVVKTMDSHAAEMAAVYEELTGYR